MSTNSPMEIHRLISSELEKTLVELNEVKALIAYSDSKDAEQLRRLADSKRDFIAGLDRARSIAFRLAMNPEAND